MANIYSKQITLESVNEITDWVEPLAKVYERQINQIDRQHEYLRERDRQAEAADPGVTALNTFKNILEFGGKAAQLYQAHKGAQAKKDADYKATLAATTTSAGLDLLDKSAQLKYKRDTYRQQKNEIEADKTQKQLDILIQEANEKGLPDVALEIEKASPRNVILQNEVIAAHILAKEGNEKRILLSGKVNNETYAQLNSIDRAKVINKAILKELDYLNLSEEAQAELLSDGLQRSNQTTRGINRARTAQAVANTQDMQFAAAFNAVKVSDNPSLVGDVITNQLKKIALKLPKITNASGKNVLDYGQAKDILFKSLERLAYDGELSTPVLTNYLDYITENPAAVGNKSTNELLLGKDKVNKLVSASRVGDTRYLDVQRGKAAEKYNDLFQRKRKGEDVSAEYDLLKAGGLLTDKQETAIEKINVRAQSQSVFEQESARANRLLSIGLNGVTQADIDGYENTEVKNALQLQFDRKEEAKLYHGDNKGSMVSIIGKAQTTVPWGPGAKLTPLGQAISNELDQKAAAFELELINKQYDKNGVKSMPNNEIGTLVKIYKEGLWAKEGGGIPDGTGRYSFDATTNTFSNMASAVLTEQRALGIAHHTFETHGEQWKARIQADATTFRKADGTIDWKKYVDSGTAFTEDDLVAMKLSGEPTEKMLYTMGYTNASFEKLLNESVKKIEQDNPGFTQRWGFSKFERAPSDVILEQFDQTLKQLDVQVDTDGEEYRGTKEYYLAKDLQYLLKRKRWVNLTPNQKNRVLKTFNMNRTEEGSITSEGKDDRLEFKKRNIGT